ncbi:hypothetical protein, partial [Natronococcus amylolyticus]|uniref:hypothetical protein n=1 Tax=Natronococcus amylolyticus TaxID=44470 RepID=UPI0019D36C86
MFDDLMGVEYLLCSTERFLSRRGINTESPHSDCCAGLVGMSMSGGGESDFPEGLPLQYSPK